jgi:hypothetical protein
MGASRDLSPLTKLFRSSKDLTPDERAMLRGGIEICRKHLPLASPPAAPLPPVKQPDQSPAVIAALAKATEDHRQKYARYIKRKQAAALQSPPPSFTRSL